MLKKMKQTEVPWGEFCNIAGPTPRNRVLEFFIDMKGLDYTTEDIASFTKLNRTTTYRIMEELIKEEYLIPTRRIGGAQFYKINESKPEVKVLLEIDNILIDAIAEEFAAKYPQSQSIRQKKEIMQTT